MSVRRAGLVFMAAVTAVMPLASLILSLPRGTRNLASPDGRWVLYGVPHQQSTSHTPELWIENLRTHRRHKVQDIPDTLRAGWFPDSARFWVEDHSASDRTQAYIYNPETLARLDVRKAVLDSDASASAFDRGHRYYNVASAAAQTLLIDFRGHTDEPPVTCFDVRYRVTRAGVVSRLSRRVRPCR